MSQIIVDEQLGKTEVLLPLRRWVTALKIESSRPFEVIKDDRVLQILRELKRPTFVTIDSKFYDKRHCDKRYCLVYFVLTPLEQNQLPGLLRRLLQLPFFNTRAARMGKVVRVSKTGVRYWQLNDDEEYNLEW
ncbi:hypothetical protein FJZ31_11915 [Candidatus Poribacteria bacterium]|nr:hypothetical protein [Candidatus Poribacteria bacterium]